MIVRANGLRYPLVGGTRQRHFDGTSLEPSKLLENAQTPTSRVHAVFGGFYNLLWIAFIQPRIIMARTSCRVTCGITT